MITMSTSHINGVYRHKEFKTLLMIMDSKATLIMRDGLLCPHDGFAFYGTTEANGGCGPAWMGRGIA